MTAGFLKMQEAQTRATADRAPSLARALEARADGLLVGACWPRRPRGDYMWEERDDSVY